MLGRGIAQDLLGQHAEAQASYRAVLAAAPQNMPALNNLALSMVLAGDPGAAVPVLQRLAARGDAPPRVLNNLSVAQAAVNEGGGHPPPPVAAAAAPAPLPHGGAQPRAAAALAQPAAFVDGVVAMEPIPDRSHRAKPASRGSNGRATPARD